MKVKNFYSKGLFILLLIMAMVIPKIPVVAASSTMIQVGKMKLEFRGNDTVVLKEVMTNGKNVPESLTYDNIKKVIIAEGIKTLPDNMFLRFPNTETIELPSSLSEFSALNGYLSLQKVKSLSVSGKNKEYKSIDGVLYSKDGKELIYYPYGKKMTKFIVPDTVTTVSIENIYLKEITLGAKVTELRLRLPALLSINVSPKNIKFISREGVLFSKDKRELIEYPSSKGKKYTIPDGTTKIMDNAFNSSNIEKVTLPEGLIYIGNGSFANTKIKYITFPKSLFIYQKDSFQDSDLTHVYVHKENGVLASQDGILYNKEKTLLLFWPQARIEENLVFPDTLTLLDLSMIKTIEKSNTITIPSALTSILNTGNNQFNKVYLSKGNTSFVLNQGILYSSNLTMIKLYPNKNPITKIVLPDEVVYLDKAMFIKENTTTSLTLSKNLKKIWLRQEMKELSGNLGFYQLTEVMIPDENLKYTSVDGILYTKDMKSLEWYPDNSPVKVFNIPESVTTIDPMQIRNAANLEELSIPANLSFHQLLYEIMEESSYMSKVIGFRCPKLEKITVHKDHKELETIDGVLYSKGGSILLLYPCGKKDKKFIVPSTVSTINTMSYNNFLEELVLPEKFNSTYKYYNKYYNMFLHFTALKTINIDQNNSDFSVKDGVLYSKDFTILVAYPIAKEDKTVVLDSKIRYLMCEENLKYALNLQEIEISNNKYWFSQNGSLYQKSPFENTPEIYLTPGSGFGEYNEYLQGLNLWNEKQEVEDNSIDESEDAYQCIKKDLIDFTLPDTYYVSKENKNVYNGEKTVYIIDDTKPLTDYFDKNAEGVETLYIAEGVIRIPQLIFTLFPNVKVVNIPSTCYLPDKDSEYIYYLDVTRAMQKSFPKLTAVNISPENDWFASIDGVVYSRNFRSAYLYPINKIDRSYSIPNTVASLSDILSGPNFNGSVLKNPYLEEIKVGASMLYPAYSQFKIYFPNLKSAELNSYNKFFSIISFLYTLNRSRD